MSDSKSEKAAERFIENLKSGMYNTCYEEGSGMSNILSTSEIDALLNELHDDRADEVSNIRLMSAIRYIYKIYETDKSLWKTVIGNQTLFIDVLNKDPYTVMEIYKSFIREDG